MTRVLLTALMATLATVAQAVKLTNSDWDVVAGESFVIEWTEAEGSVSIRLKSGPANNLVTVQEITSGESGESFTWSVPADLDTAQYAIEVEDEAGNVNYSVQFPISGDGSSQPSTSAEEEEPVSTTVASETPSQPAEVSSVPTNTETEVTEPTSEAQEPESETEAPPPPAESTTESTTEGEEPTGAETTTTRETTRPSNTDSETGAAESDPAESEVPDSGAAGRRVSAFAGAAVLGAVLLA